jgi:hypothetical protein
MPLKHRLMRRVFFRRKVERENRKDEGQCQGGHRNLLSVPPAGKQVLDKGGIVALSLKGNQKILVSKRMQECRKWSHPCLDSHDKEQPRDHVSRGSG